MLEIGGKPILWHIMRIYSKYGFDEFVLALGYKGAQIKNFFLNYEALSSDITVRLGGGTSIEIHNQANSHPWTVTLADTGEEAMTGARLKRVERYLGGAPFHLTYGDGVADLDVGRLARFHAKHGRLGTVTGVHPLARFGELSLQDTKVREFREKPQVQDSHINGGFFVFEPRFLDYVEDVDACVLEQEPLRKLASEGELHAFIHGGFWHCMDTLRDYQRLNVLWASGKAPWKVW